MTAHVWILPFFMEHPLQVLCLKALAAFSAFLKHENISKDDVFIDFIPHFVPEFRDKLPKVKAFFILFFAVVYFRPRHLYPKHGGQCRSVVAGDRVSHDPLIFSKSLDFRKFYCFIGKCSGCRCW